MTPAPITTISAITAVPCGATMRAPNA